MIKWKWITWKLFSKYSGEMMYQNCCFVKLVWLSSITVAKISAIYRLVCLQQSVWKNFHVIMFLRLVWILNKKSSQCIPHIWPWVFPMPETKICGRSWNPKSAYEKYFENCHISNVFNEDLWATQTIRLIKYFTFYLQYSFLLQAINLFGRMKNKLWLFCLIHHTLGKKS